MKIPGAGSSVERKETPSLFRRAVEKKTVEAEVKAKPILEEKSNSFDEEMVVIAWKKYKQERYENGASDTEKLVLDRRVEKCGEHDVKIYLHSQLETSILDKFEADLIRYFRKTLSNTHIQLEKEVNEQEKSKSLYTSREKFEYMAQQNPTLRELKERLGLDFEY